MAWWTKNKQNIDEIINVRLNKMANDLSRKFHLNESESQSIRQKMARAESGGYDGADTLHNVFFDYGYPEEVNFDNYWNMYRRFGIAKNVIELPPSVGWMTAPKVDGSSQFDSEFETLVKEYDFWNRMKGLDIRQRVGRYAGMFMRVRDNKTPDQPIEGTLSGLSSLVELMPLYESQLTVVDTDQDPTSDTYGQPKMYEYSGSAEGDRNEEINNTIKIHTTRVVPISENADAGWIYGIPALESVYNSLMDLRKIIGAGGEGFYKNAAQSVIFDLKETSNGNIDKDLLDSFNEKYDEFAHNRFRRAMWTPGMDTRTLESNLADPKNHFANALNDVSAGSMIPATILIGQQTGRLASSEDSRNFLSVVKSRRENFMSKMIRAVVDWMILYGVLPSSDYEIIWDDLLARSTDEKLANAGKMTEVNERQFKSGGDVPFSGEEIRDAAGFDLSEMVEPGSEEIIDDLNE